MTQPAGLTRHTDGSFTVEPGTFTAYEATGTDCQGRRNAKRRAPLAYLRGLNYAFKTVWGVTPSGQRVRLYTVDNRY